MQDFSPIFRAAEEYIISATPSGRIVFADENFTKLIGTDISGRNINEIMPDETAAGIIALCSSGKKYSGETNILGMSCSVSACSEDGEIDISISPLPFTRAASFPQKSLPVNSITHALSSSLSVLFASYKNISATDENRKDLAYMEKHLLNIMRFSKNMSDYAAYDTGTYFVNYKLAVFNDFLEKLVKKLNDLSVYTKAEITLSMPEEKIMCCFDEEKIQRVFLNLIARSLSCCENPKIRIILRPAVNGKINIIIKDNAKGRDVLKELSGLGLQQGDDGEFFQNLGLAVANRFLAMHDGSLVVVSENESGSAVSIILPQHTEKAPPAFSSLISGYSGGFDPYKLELSEVLPIEAFFKK